MSECRDRDFEKKLEFYLLDLLSEEDAAAFEEHLLVCDACALEVEQFNAESIQLLNSGPIKDELAEIVADANRSVKPETESQKARFWEPSKRRWGLLVAAAAVLAIAVFSPWHFQLQLGDEASASGVRVAILPFDNMTTDTAASWQGRAISNLLITDLTDSKQITVIPEQKILSILQHSRSKSELDPSYSAKIEIAKEAGARWVVLGSIVQSKPTLTVVATVIEVSTQDTLSTHIAEQSAGQDLFSLIDKLSMAIRGDAGSPGMDVDTIDRRVSEMTTASLDAFRHYIDGVKYLQRFEFYEARASFHRALEYDSAMAMAYYYLSMAQGEDAMANRAAIGKALAHIDRATVREQYYIRSRSAFALGDTAHAISHLLALCESYPDESEAYYVLAFLEAARRDSSAAISYAQAAIERDPYNKIAFNFLAYQYQAIGEYDKALTALDEYIRLAPDEANPHDTRGEILALQGKFEEALESYSTALAINPDFQSSRINKTYLLLLVGQNDKIQPEIEYLLGAEDGEARSWGRTLEMATLIRSGRFEQALEMTPNALEQDVADNQNIGRLMKLAMQVNLLVSLGRSEEALQALNSMSLLYNRVLPSAHVGPLSFRGYVLATLGRSSEAEQLARDLRQDFDKDGGETGYNYIMGFIMLAEENWTQAAAFLESAPKEGHDYLLQFGLARAYIGQRRSDEAIDKLESLLGSFEWKRALWGMIDVKLNYYLGIAYEQAGESKLALQQYEHFLRLWSEADVEVPELVDARERQARLTSAP